VQQSEALATLKLISEQKERYVYVKTLNFVDNGTVRAADWLPAACKTGTTGNKKHS